MHGVQAGWAFETSLDLQWAQPWFGVSTDLDMYVISAGAVVGGLGTSEARNAEGETGTTHHPFEFVRVDHVPAAGEIAHAVLELAQGGVGLTVPVTR